MSAKHCNPLTSPRTNVGAHVCMEISEGVADGLECSTECCNFLFMYPRLERFQYSVSKLEKGYLTPKVWSLKKERRIFLPRHVSERKRLENMRWITCYSCTIEGCEWWPFDLREKVVGICAEQVLLNLRCISPRKLRTWGWVGGPRMPW